MKKALFTGLITSLICMLCMVLNCLLISKQSIEKQVITSLQEIQKKELFSFIQEGNYQTIQDNYADTILLNIMYHQDSQTPFYSTLAGKYYEQDGVRIDEALIKSIQNNLKANTYYPQYWHGMVIVLKPLLMIFTLQEIRTIIAIFIVILLSIVGIYCIKHKLCAWYICFLLGYMLIQGWMSFYCIEYSTSIFIMSIMCSILCYLDYKGLIYKDMSCFFVFAGVLTCFFDFLTTETIVCLLPCTCIYAIYQRDKQLHRNSWQKFLKYICLFGIAYASMFFVKWSLVSICMGVDKMHEILQQAVFRIQGDIELGLFSNPSNSFAEKISGAILRNIVCVMPFLEQYTYHVLWIIVVIGVLVIASLIYIMHTSITKYSYILLIIACLPLIRFLLLSNHSYVHFFFTYRALWTSVTCISYFIWDSCIKDRMRWKMK